MFYFLRKRWRFAALVSLSCTHLALFFSGSYPAAAMTMRIGGFYFPSGLNGILGGWHSYPITQRSIDGMYLPVRTFQAELNLSGDGTYAYTLVQSESPQYVLAVRGRYTVRPSSQVNAKYSGYELQIYFEPQQSAVQSQSGGTTLSSGEVTRFEYEGFPGLDAREYGLHVGSSQIDIKGTHSITLKR